MHFRTKDYGFLDKDYFDISKSTRAKVLVEALPWIEDISGKTIVIKYGGAAMVDEKYRQQVVDDIVLLKLMGAKPVIVHGGGPAINKMLKTFNEEVEFLDGLRVTNDKSMDIVKMTLIGQVNQGLVRAINIHGSIAVGLAGNDAKTIIGAKLDEAHMRTGKVERVNTTLLKDLINMDYIPVLATIAYGEQGEYNINADTVAGKVAASLGAQKIVFITDVDGFFTDYPNEDSLVSRMTLCEAKDLLNNSQISAGMIPKFEACLTALSAGTNKAHIVNGTYEHSLILEICTDAGVGTMITRSDGDEQDPNFVEASVSNFADKLDDSLTTVAGGIQYVPKRKEN
ncbi:MAG: acetylglutamate kinase [Coriobacteriales bacterium]|nr:acetylglutamate kinase [Coriobacteriales bacterium]